MKSLILLLSTIAYTTAQFTDAVIPSNMGPCGTKCITNIFAKASTAMGCKLNTYPCYCTKYEFYTGLGACSLACGEEVDLEVSEWRNIFCQAGAGAPAYTPIVDPLAAPTGTNGTGSGACTDPMICPMPIPVKASPVPVVPVVVAPVPKTVVPSSPSVPKAGSSSLPKSGGPVKGQGAAKGPFVPKGQRPKGPYVDFEN